MKTPGILLFMLLIFPCFLSARVDSTRSRWSAGVRFGMISNYNEKGVAFEPAGDSVVAYDVGMKNALDFALTVEYEIMRDTGVGLTLAVSYGQAALEFGLVGLQTGYSAHLADGTVRRISMTAIVDLGRLGLFNHPEHNDFALSAGVSYGRAWLENLKLDPQTQESVPITGASSGSEQIIGIPVRVKWRIFDSPWVLSVGGEALYASGNSFLQIHAISNGQSISAQGYFSFSCFNAGIEYRF